MPTVIMTKRFHPLLTHSLNFFGGGKYEGFDIHRDVKNEPLKHYLARLLKPDIGFDFHELQLEGKRISDY